MRKILFILILLVSVSMITEAKTYKKHYTQKNHNKVYVYKKRKTSKRVCHYLNPNVKFKKCGLSKIYKAK